MRRLREHRVQKPWGRRDIAAPYGPISEQEEPLGEVHFIDPADGDPELLVKYLFTSEKLSIQVHPDDEAARAAGLPRGKDECWFVLEARPDAVIGLGLHNRVDREQLRSAALDGSIEELVDWRPAAAGDFHYSEAGTIHAIGPGVQIIEIQQNCETTYRLYDYGRPRELHLEEAVAAANPAPHEARQHPREIGPGRTLLANGRFSVERWTGPLSVELRAEAATPVWLIPTRGEASLGEERLQAPGVWIADSADAIDLSEGAELLVAYVASEGAELFEPSGG